jgi:hypothetical protein
VKTITQAELCAEMERRFGPDAKAWKFFCPMCKTPQSASDFYAAGFKPGTGEVNKYLGFSCIGRFTKAGPHQPGQPPGRGCNWTLGGLFQIHQMEVVLPNGQKSPCMEIAPAEEKVEDVV